LSVCCTLLTTFNESPWAWEKGGGRQRLQQQGCWQAWLLDAEQSVMGGRMPRLSAVQRYHGNGTNGAVELVCGGGRWLIIIAGGVLPSMQAPAGILSISSPHAAACSTASLLASLSSSSSSISTASASDRLTEARQSRFLCAATS
jgi:hypothetical protein